MDIIQYNGQKVYTHSKNAVTADHLKNTTVGEGTIMDAYFFTLVPGKGVAKTKFNLGAIKRYDSGLMIDLDVAPGNASVSIAGLEKIMKFLEDTKTSLEDQSTLIDRKVKTYFNNDRLLGISVGK